VVVFLFLCHSRKFLENVKTNLQPPAQFADTLVTLAGEGTIEKAVNQVDCSVEHLDEARHTDEGVDFLSVNVTENLDFEVSVNLAGCVIKLFHCSNFILTG
jgi:hypothetical protein